MSLFETITYITNHYNTFDFMIHTHILQVGENKIHFICNEYLMNIYLGNEYNVSFLHNRLTNYYLFFT